MINLNGLRNMFEYMTDDEIEDIAKVYIRAFNILGDEVEYFAVVDTCLKELTNRNE